MMNRIATMRAFFAAFLLGVSCPFAFAPFSFFPLAILAPAGLLALIRGTSKRRAFWLGYLFGLGQFGAGVYWIYISIYYFGGVSLPIALFIMALFFAYLACYPAFTCYLTQRYFEKPTAVTYICAFPAIWVFLEWARSFIITGFPWLLIGYSQTNSPLRGYAPLFSVYGSSLAAIISAGLLVTLWTSFKDRDKRAMLKSGIALVLIWVIGGLLALIPWTKPSAPAVDISLVQGNIPQSIKWSPEHVSLSLNTYSNLTTPLLSPKHIIIWPEAAIPLPLHVANDYISALDQEASEANASIILGIPMRLNQKYYNAVISLGKDKSLYVKRHLVPFGEYTPLVDVFAKALQFMNIPMSEMAAGPAYQRPFKVQNLTFLPAICYESAFPDMGRLAPSNIDVLLTVTNDAWFGGSTAEDQHLQMGAMRAIEMGRPMIFATNDGITAFINQWGQTMAALPQRQVGVLTARIQPMSGLTPWMHNGLSPILLIMVLLIIYAHRVNRKITATRHT